MAEEIDYASIVPRDVVGFHVFNGDRGMGLGNVVDLTVVGGERMFVCESGDSTVNREVSFVMNYLREYGYDLCTEPWTVADADDVGEYGVDEAEIADRAGESWTTLAVEFGLTEDEVEEIILG